MALHKLFLLALLAFTSTAGHAQGVTKGSVLINKNNIAKLEQKILATDFSHRYALVIGNANYTQGPLKNPENDAQSMRVVLEKSGFTVIFKTNLYAHNIDSAIAQFGNLISQNHGVNLFYYSGHGIQYQGENFLLSTQAAVMDTPDIAKGNTRLKTVLQQMQRACGGFNLIIMDACRSNPFEGLPGIKQGLSDVDDAPLNTTVFYATKPNQVALDGSGDNSPFTQALLNHIEQDTLEFYEIARRVTRDVLKTTKNQQCPIVMGTATDEFYFKNRSPRKPVLHVLSIGISKYTQSLSLNLRYADAGALQFLNLQQALYAADSGQSYSSINPYLITNANGTRLQIMKALNDLKAQIHEGDVLLFYFNGHILESIKEAYFLPADANPQLLELEGIPAQALFEVVQNFPCKSALFIDMVNTGSTGEYNNNIYNQIAALNSPSSNVAVITSNGEFELSFESTQWQGSLFIHSLDLTLHELAQEGSPAYLQAIMDGIKHQATKLSNGQQRPVQYLPEGFLNFAIYGRSILTQKPQDADILETIPSR